MFHQQYPELSVPFLFLRWGYIYRKSDLWIIEKLVGRDSIPEELHCIFLGAGKVVDRREQCLDLKKMQLNMK